MDKEVVNINRASRNDTHDVRPRLLDDVRYIECRGGVYIENGQGSRVLTGEHAYAWMHRLVPYLDGTRSLAEITRGLPGPHREMVEQLISTLADNGFVAEVQQDDPHGLTESEQAEFAEAIAFIRYRYGSAEARFQKLRNARILLIGHGPMASLIESVGRGSGWLHVDRAQSVLPSGDLCHQIESRDLVV